MSAATCHAPKTGGRGVHERPLADPALCHNRCVKLLRMKPGHGEVLLAEGDVEIAEDEAVLVEAFREQLDQGLWAAVPLDGTGGRREAQLVRSFDEVPRDADRVIFFPQAAGGR
jgi:molybdopterin converting factor small subunit